MTPLEEAELGGRRVLLKREDQHELGAFKWRGALPVLEEWKQDGAQTVVTASTGNHGAATAWAAERLGLRAVVYVPEQATRAKVTLAEDLGAELRFAGADLDQTKAEAHGYAEAEGLPFFEDGAERPQYEGYAAIADEILDQAEKPPAAVVVPVGNGALLGGIGLGPLYGPLVGSRRACGMPSKRDVRRRARRPRRNTARRRGARRVRESDPRGLRAGDRLRRGRVCGRRDSG